MFITLAVNTPRIYPEDQVKPLITETPLVHTQYPSRFAIGNVVNLNYGADEKGKALSKDFIRIPNCIVAGVHFYPNKVAYDLYVPDGPDDYVPAKADGKKEDFTHCFQMSIVIK